MIEHFSVPQSKKAVFLLICLFVMSVLFLPEGSQAQDKEKIIRVGWYDSSYNTVDENGVRTGYAYEYQ